MNHGYVRAVVAKVVTNAVLTVVVGVFALQRGLALDERLTDDMKTDEICEHVEIVTESNQVYNVDFEGTIDGVMCRSPIGYCVFGQVWQPNRSLMIENIGANDVMDPWIVVNGKRNWFSADDIFAEATRGCTNVAEKVRAVYEFRRKNRGFHFNDEKETFNPLKAFNVFGYGLCPNESFILRYFWQRMGLRARKCSPIGHSISQVEYDGGWHLLDSDENGLYLLPDNKTVASEVEVTHDHDLVKRCHGHSILSPDSRIKDAMEAALFVNTDPERKPIQSDKQDFGQMGMTLRPNESIEYRWDNLGKFYSKHPPPNIAPEFYSLLLDKLCNGKWRYSPDLFSSCASRGVEESTNLAFDVSSGVIRTRNPKGAGGVTWRFACPYVFVGGKAKANVQLKKGARCEWRYRPAKVKFDNHLARWVCQVGTQVWQTVASVSNGEKHQLTASLDDLISPAGSPTYVLDLQLVTEGDVVVAKPEFEFEVQMAMLALPELEVGRNIVEYRDATEGKRNVRVTHRWLERKTWHPPTAPGNAVSPKDEATVEGSRVEFVWSPARSPDGKAIIDYHFELSEYPDMRWPLSSSFEKLVARSACQAHPEYDVDGNQTEDSWKLYTGLMTKTAKPVTPDWSVPRAGLLNGGETYYWHVRACDERGVWGPWSKTFQFAVKAPNVPLDVKLSPGEKPSELILSWRANPTGERPVIYKVYGSDEMGFTVNENEHLVYRGKGFPSNIKEYLSIPDGAPGTGLVLTPPNLLATVKETRMKVVGPDLTHTNANRCFYRVVAVDAQGSESGPSAYAEVKRPFVLIPETLKAEAGQPCRFEIDAIRSIGDLYCRGPGKAAFWWAARDRTAFKGVNLPAGFQVVNLGQHTGVILGKPLAPGVYDIRFDAVCNGSTNRYSAKVTVEK